MGVDASSVDTVAGRWSGLSAMASLAKPLTITLRLEPLKCAAPALRFLLRQGGVKRIESWVSQHENHIGAFTGISFEADSVEKTYDELVQRGVEFIQPPKKERWGATAIFKDADGNQFVISSR